MTVNDIDSLRTLVELAKSSKGVGLDSRGIVINPKTGKRFPKANTWVRELWQSAEKRGKFVGMFSNGNDEELRGPLELKVVNANFSKYERHTAPWVIRRYDKVKSYDLDFRGVYAGTFAFFHSGVYHEIDLVDPRDIPNAAKLERDAKKNPVLKQALRYKTRYTPGYLVFTLKEEDGLTEDHAKAVETEFRSFVESSKMEDRFRVRRKEMRVYGEPRKLVDGSETSKYNAARLGGRLASEYTGKDYLVDNLIYVVDGIDNKAEKDMKRISVLVVDVDNDYVGAPFLQEGVPPVFAMDTSKDALRYAKHLMETGNGIGTFVCAELQKAFGTDGAVHEAIGGLPLSVALDAMASLKHSGVSIRELSPKVIIEAFDTHRTMYEREQ